MPMNELFKMRDQMIQFYKKHEQVILPILKYILTITVLFMIGNTMGYAKLLTRPSLILILGLTGIFLSPQLIMLFFILVTSYHALAGTLQAGIVVFVVLLVIYLLYVRLYPVESLFIVATLIAYKFHIPYIIPLVAGLFSSLATVVALIIGITLWYCAPQMIMMMESQGAEIADIVGIINAQMATLQEVFKTDMTLISSIVILSVILLTVYIIRKQNADYAEYVAILVGAVMNLVGFLFAILLLRIEVSILGLMLSTIICAMIAAIAQFFAKVADYSRAETVQFEDEKNYYYVKVVPKIVVKQSKKQVQHNYTRDDILNE